MRKFILAVFALLFSASAHAHVSAVPFPEIGSLRDVTHQAAFFMPQTYLPSSLPRGDVICDITTGVATGIGAGTCVAHPATCNGVADDAQAFADFNSWANLTWQASFSGLVEMYIPPGKSCSLPTDVTLTASSFDPGCATPTTYGFDCSWGSGRWSKGIKKFLMNFFGSSVTASGGVIFFLGAADGICHRGLAATNGCDARTATASTGATSVTLLNTSLCSRFTVGNYVVMTGYDMQGLYLPSSGYGYPPNPSFYDYAIVTSTASCAGSGVINLDRALTNDYKSTWPLNCPGSSFEADCGGPATLYALPVWWNVEAEYRGGTLNNGTNQTNGQGRKITYTSITWTGGIACAYPTQAIDWTVNGGDWSICKVENDKIVVNATYQNLTSIAEIKTQSMSPRNFNVSSSSVVSLLGSPRNTTMTNVTLGSNDVRVGTLAFGRTDSFNCTNCTNSGVFTHEGANESGTVSAGTWGISGQGGGPYSATMTGGVITIPVAHGAVTWAVPGTNFTWSYGGASSVYVYQVTDVTQDPTNQYVTTNCVGAATVCGVGGGLPASSGTLSIRSHPSPKFNCTNCTGTRIWASMSNGPADAPLFSYQKFTPDVSWPTSANAAYQFQLWGKLSSMVATVTGPYGGGGVLNLKPTGQFVYTVYPQSTGASGSYVPSIDLKTAGTRTVTSGGCVGCGGADASTAYTFTPQWMAGALSPVISSQPAWAGTVDFTFTTDQGVVNPP